MKSNRIPPLAVMVIVAALALALMAGYLSARADGDTSPPEWPTQTPPSLTAEPYPPPGGDPYPAPYPAPPVGAYLPIVAEESYP